MSKLSAKNIINQQIKEIKNERSLVLVTNGFFEVLVNILINSNCKNKKKIDENNAVTYGIKLLLVNELNIIDDDLYKILDYFRRLRNNAAHDPIFEINPNSLRHLIKIIKEYIKTHDINTIAGNTNTLCDVCIDTTILLYNTHSFLFKEKLEI